MGSTLNPFELSGYKLDGQFIAQVVNNNDPLKMGRVQISLPILWGNETPWAVPKIPQGIGGSSPAGFFSVPNNGTDVYIELQNGDVHFPFYVGTVLVQSTVPAVFQENYPTRYGFIDELNNQFIVDRTAKTITLVHSSGALFTIDESGNITRTAIINDTTNCKDYIVNASSQAIINSPNVQLGTGGGLGPANAVVRFSDLQAAIANHVHGGVQSGSSDTGTGVGSQTASSTVFAE